MLYLGLRLGLLAKRKGWCSVAAFLKLGTNRIMGGMRWHGTKNVCVLAAPEELTADGDWLGLVLGLLDGLNEIALHPAVRLTSATTVSDQAPAVSSFTTQKNAPPLHAKSVFVPPDGV